VDVYLQQDSTFPSTGYNTSDQTAESQAFDVGNYVWSAMEHGIIEQLQNSNLVAASTVKMLEVANTNSQTVYLASNANWTSGANIRGHLAHYDSATLSVLDNRISQGFFLLLPQNGSNHVAGANTWAGNGYVQLSTLGGGRVMGMIIGGKYNGGYVSDSTATINIPFIVETGENQPNFFNSQSSTASVPPQFGADPVNLVDGSFQISSTDLSVGQTEPRGFSLTRYYSSARRNSNPVGMAPGWLHNYYCSVLPISDPQAGLGTATAQQMAPMIVATYAALNLYNNTNLDAKNWMVTALIAKWGVDQLINNAVSVNLGKDTVQFVKQPDGSFAPPGNSTLSLLQTNGAYWLQERHGRTFKFGTSGLLTNIVDQYGQTMKFAYNSNSFVTNIVDWKGRGLTFTYTNGALISVADSAGRSVSYSYTGGDLTSYTDPEQKTYSFAYDTNHEVVATYDALGRLVVTNFYDGSGHITTQLTQGDTNKAWQVYASGYQTVEIDPAGDQRTFMYDTKSRLIGIQDGLGDFTQTVYDGQDHVIQTVSPLGETNQFIYDGNNNLIETIDPLGFTNAFTFDSQNRMVASTDGNGHTSRFGYNAQFDLTGSTNGNGDYVIMAYNSDGTLASRQDSAGTTSYGYDSNGQLNSITNAGGLGSESFVNNAFGDPTSHTDARGFATTFAYNNRRELTNTVAPTNVTTTVTFDANANILTTTDPRGFVLSNTWSVTRLLLSTTLPAVPQGSPVITSIYDSRDWLARSQNPLGKNTYYTNDAAHRLLASTDPLQRTTTFGYDSDSRHTTTTDAALEQTTQTWDARNHVVRIVDAATNVVGKVYDGAGNLVYLTNRNGNVWHFQYDGANRLTNTISPLNHSASQVYNNRGLLQSSTDPLTQTSSFGYDARGRLTSKTDNIGTNNYAYDGNNNLTLLTNLGTGMKLSWGYDAYNHPTSFTNAAGYVIQYRYDASGNLTNLIYPGSRTVKYFYDSNNHLTNVTDWAGRQTTYSYDLAGHLLGVARPNNTVRTINFDDAGEVTNIVEQTTAKFPITFYTLHYDPAGRTDWEFKGPLPHAFTPPIRSMTYDADNRLSTVNGTNVTLDADGNLTYGPGTNGAFGSFAFDARNELTSGGGITYGYDPAGNRVALTNGSSTNAFVINPLGSQVLMRINNGTTNYYVYGKGLVYEIDETATATNAAYYHFDARGSTVALTDGGGNLTDQIEYSPYGTVTHRTGNSDTPFLYNGRYGVMTDPNGLLYMRARYYSPYISRFLNPDPSGFSGGLNFFAFANGNPISLVDPFGLGALTGDAGGTYWEGVGNVFKGYGDAVWNLAAGLGNAVSHPINTVDGLANAIANPGQTGQAIWNSVGNTFNNLTGPNPEAAGQAFGNILITGVSIAAPFAGAGAVADVGELGNAAGTTAVQVGDYTLTDTVAGHLGEEIGGVGDYSGSLSRPYIQSPSTINEIISTGQGVADPGGLSGALRYDVPGTFRGSEGTWELVVDPNTKTIYHFNFTTGN
jgi:RHS repeat-associated protein